MFSWVYAGPLSQALEHLDDILFFIIKTKSLRNWGTDDKDAELFAQIQSQSNIDFKLN